MACYAAESSVIGAEGPVSALNSLVHLAESWLQGKGAQALAVGSNQVKLRDGRSAVVNAQHYSTATTAVWDISVDEPTPTGRFLTRIVLGAAERSLHLFVELRAGVSGYRLAPHEVDVRCPQILRDLLLSRTWTVGKTPVSVKPIKWGGELGANKLLAVMEHGERNLPIVVVSEYEGRPLSPALPEDLARDVSGLAIVAHLDQGASWAVTNRRGREWACYDGAIRVYWPMRMVSRRASDHPFWTRSKLIESTGSALSAASRIRNQLRQQLLELSTYAVDEPGVLSRIREDATRVHFEEMRRAAEEKGDSGTLAEEWFNRSVELEADLSRAREKIALLQDQVGSLSEVWKYTQSDKVGVLLPEEAVLVESVADAVNRARAEFSNELIFGNDVDAGVLDVATDAGPPEKVFEHLKALAEMGRIRQAGSLGKTMIDWFAESGIAASYESDFVQNNRSERQKRTWSDGTDRRLFTAHLKPNDGTSPDRCIRIYFDFDEALGKVIVGWVGRHP